jgi:hypothetical protein
MIRFVLLGGEYSIGNGQTPGAAEDGAVIEAL